MQFSLTQCPRGSKLSWTAQARVGTSDPAPSVPETSEVPAMNVDSGVLAGRVHVEAVHEALHDRFNKPTSKQEVVGLVECDNPSQVPLLEGGPVERSEHEARVEGCPAVSNRSTHIPDPATTCRVLLADGYRGTGQRPPLGLQTLVS
jgi:hypothetical protein